MNNESTVEPITVSFTLNGRPTALVVTPLMSLRTALREELHLHATKAGCGQGSCGSCTVHLDGEPALSCLVPVATLAGRSVTTLEGLAPGPELHALQAAFFDNFAAQCGYCTPGMIMAAAALLAEQPDPTRQEIEAALAGNLCRCTGYVPIIAAIEDAVARLRQEQGETAKAVGS